LTGAYAITAQPPPLTGTATGGEGAPVSVSQDDLVIVGTRAEMAARGRVGGLVTSSRHDMSAIAKRAREGLDAKFLRDAGGDPDKAGVLRRLHFARLNLASVRARSRRKVAA
jgi:hypothetical protein